MNLCNTVLILPMRNGNRLKMQKLEKKILKRSYPTYEEWKQKQGYMTDAEMCELFLSYL